ncbi:MAG: TIGR00341 family protein, partial [Anaerolineales bacterium]|nr:TIGR00341 family protein [Anaerolineales bacterium]
ARLPAEGGAKLGTIAENIIPVSPCPVILYRLGESRKVGRIVVPIQEGREAHTASELAIALGRRLKAPVEALFLEIESPVGESAYWNDERQRQATSFDQSEADRVTQSVVQVEDPVEGFLLYAQDEDLAVVDINEQANWESWLRGDSSLDALRMWPGAFLVNASGAVALPRSWEEKVRSWLNPTVTQFEGEELVRDAEESSFSSLDFLVLIIISAILAAFGLILNSNAVIIGAMLVAPLMTPLIALATGLVVGNIRIIRQATVTLLQAIFAALLVALLVGWISATSIVTAEMAGRGNVTFLDMGVALASGFIGAYAKARKDIPSALAGVAIAAALMPPLVTIGLAISFREWALAQGATLLFLTNIVSITLAAWVTFLWLGLRPGKKYDPIATRRASTILVVSLVIILVALSLQSINTTASGRIESVLRDSFQQAELVNYEVRQSDPLEVLAVVRQPVGSIDDSSEIIEARESLEELLGEPVKLSVVLEPLVDADVAAANLAIQTQIDDILERTLKSGTLVESVFLAGNPSIVFALVSTDADPATEPFVSEIRAAEAAMTEVVRVPVKLQILTVGTEVGVEAETSNAAFADVIEKTLKENLQNSELVEFTFEVGNPFIVEVTITTELDSTSDELLNEIEAVEDALSDALGITVLLDVTIQDG